MNRAKLIFVALVAVWALAAGCSGEAASQDEVVGVVTEVTGDLAEIESFVVLDAEGNSHKFTPGDGLTVMGAPPSHLRDHVVSGEPVKVIFHASPDDELIADDVVHAGGASDSHED